MHGRMHGRTDAWMEARTEAYKTYSLRWRLKNLVRDEK